jgi:tripartite-type tricarboxylate transporter receptor subunit TctC
VCRRDQQEEKMTQLFRNACLGLSLALATGTACAQNVGAAQPYPSKPIRIVAPGIGGSADFVARMMAQGLTSNNGWQVIVDNRANGVVPGEIVSRATPDGYTLLLTTNSLWVGPLMSDNTPYNPARDFTPIVLATVSPNVLLVYPGLPAKSVKELVDLARAKPGQLNYGSGATGASSHLAAELMKSMASINMVRIPYKSNAAQIADLMAGQIQLFFSNATAAPPHMKSGKLRGLAVTSGQAFRLFPELPPISATVPGYDSVGMAGAFGPARMPPAMVTRLNQEIIRALDRPDIKDKFNAAGIEAVGGTPQHFASTIKSEVIKWGKIIKDAGIREE